MERRAVKAVTYVAEFQQILFELSQTGRIKTVFLRIHIYPRVQSKFPYVLTVDSWMISVFIELQVIDVRN